MNVIPLKVLMILLIQLLVYLTCVNFFELYILIIGFSILGLFYIQRDEPKESDKRLLELTRVETIYIAFLYCFFLIGHNAKLYSYVIFSLILLPQGLLFVRASFRGNRYIKCFNTGIHLLLVFFFR